MLNALQSRISGVAAGPAKMQPAYAGDAGTPTKTAAPVGRADAAAGGGLPEGRRPAGQRATARFPMPNGRIGRRARRGGRRQSAFLEQLVESIDNT